MAKERNRGNREAKKPKAAKGAKALSTAASAALLQLQGKTPLPKGSKPG